LSAGKVILKFASVYNRERKVSIRNSDSVKPHLPAIKP